MVTTQTPEIGKVNEKLWKMNQMQYFQNAETHIEKIWANIFPLTHFYVIMFC